MIGAEMMYKKKKGKSAQIRLNRKTPDSNVRMTTGNQNNSLGSIPAIEIVANVWMISILYASPRAPVP